MSLAVQIRQHGGPEELQIVDVPVGEPGPGEIRIRHHAVGLNFIDVYHRTGLYPLNMPASIGMEAAGVVEAVGEGVTHLAPGDRAAYASNPPGSYCEARVMPAKTVCKLPDAIIYGCVPPLLLKDGTPGQIIEAARQSIEAAGDRRTPTRPGTAGPRHRPNGPAGRWASSGSGRGPGPGDPSARRPSEIRRLEPHRGGSGSGTFSSEPAGLRKYSED